MLEWQMPYPVISRANNWSAATFKVFSSLHLFFPCLIIVLTLSNGRLLLRDFTIALVIKPHFLNVLYEGVFFKPVTNSSLA